MAENTNPFAGRTIAVVDDLSVDEQRYLYRESARLKRAWLEGDNLDSFRIRDTETAVYLMFLEDSTRTKESFRNAARFHDVKLNVFDAGSSSFKKSESLIDTVKMLFGYSRRSIFVMRTKMEGVCRALEEQIGAYADRLGRERPVFINGGDGRHEHPTQEYLDEFTFLEKKNWDNAGIHIALIGDLFHGRTIHSKSDGLRAFREVKVDLVAPEELELPPSYGKRMEQNGFEVRSWPSIDAYLDSAGVADTWYFTRLQLERMGDEVRDRAPELRQAVTFRREYLERLPEGVRFYHPLPRHREHPVIPAFLDATTLNGWDGQSINGYFTRIVELALVAGVLGDEFTGTPATGTTGETDFVESIPVTRRTRVEDRYKVGIKPVDDGIVIDHIARGLPIGEIWDRVDRIRRILKLNVRSSHGVFHSSASDIFKGIISLPDIMEVDRKDLKKLAAVSPECTLNIVKDRSVTEKYRLHMPPKIYNFAEISCRNDACVTYPAAHQHVPVSFYRAGEETFACRYCGRHHGYDEIWDM